MEYRCYGKSEEKVSLLGFGCMRFPVISSNSSKIDDKSATELIDYAISKGVNYFDTAYIYHEGESELFIGQALKKYPRDSFYLADKLPLWGVKTLEKAAQIFEEQLKKCDVEYFDYYLMHAISKDKYDKIVNLGIYDKFKEYQKQGKIKHLGFSFHDTPDVMELMLNTFDWDFVQIQLNYLDWTLQDSKKLYELVNAKGIQCIVMEPVRGGALASLSTEANDILKGYSPDRSIASWAIRYAASFPNVLTVLSGMSDFTQVEDNISSFSPFSPLSVEENDVLQDALETYKKTQTIPCTACRYCMECPSGVDIPLVFKIYNDYSLTKDSYALQDNVENLAPEKHPDKCTECGVCTKHCPQTIGIPKQMKLAAELFKKSKK
ncbi:MAG: Fe-S oxidoreductase [Clostridiales bacterium GWF2_36_10]|nr:MAG: Fe-S oxidoreductase [Clostridiales bacterium GWF2_36_10]HAN21352.1 Fe-S oxidoreductase [Clostridiales bacterium]